VNTCEHKGTRFVNKDPERASVIWKCRIIANRITSAITQHSSCQEDTPLIAVSLVTAVTELTQLIYNYWTYW